MLLIERGYSKPKRSILWLLYGYKFIARNWVRLHGNFCSIGVNNAPKS